MTVLRWQELTRVELGETLPDVVLVLPIGATEQHGPHLATCVDATLAERLALDGAARAARPAQVVVAPALPYGASDHHLPFGGTLSLSAATFTRVLDDLLRSAVASGARRVLVLNGHGGNSAVSVQAAAEAAREHGIVAAASDYWDLVSVEGPWGEDVPGHAGAFETALMLAARSEAVRRSELRPSPGAVPRRSPGLTLHDPELWRSLDGFTDDPRRGDAEAGAAALDRLADAVAAAIEAVADLEPRS